MLKIERHPNNPIIKPDMNFSWQTRATFNGCPIRKDDTTHLFFRAISQEQYSTTTGSVMEISTIGKATSTDGISFENRRPFIIPEYPWERYGCEDPRVTEIDGTYYIFYTALSDYPFNADNIKVAVAVSDDLETIREKHLVTPFNAKAMALFPEKIRGKMTAIVSVNTDRPPAKMGIISFDTPEQMWSKDHWKQWYNTPDTQAINLKRSPDDHTEVGAPPIMTEDGWLLIYSHINHYGKPNVLFGIETVLLDKKDPTIIVGRTTYPLIMPEDLYELYGMIPNIVFPSGALVEGDELRIYYGAADTTCCVATTSVKKLLAHIHSAKEKPVSFKRYKHNPILEPIQEHPWESRCVFNPTAFYADDTVHIVYRAMSEDNTSVLGYATSKDGYTVDERLDEPIYTPRAEFEQKKGSKTGNSGCEDPRITVLDDTVYMFYTAYDGVSAPRVAFTSLPLEKFLARQWDWKEPVLISPPNMDNKDAALFPRKVDGQYLILHRLGDDIDIAYVPHLDFDGKTWMEERRWLKQRREYWDNRKVGIAGPPFETKEGLVLFYHGVSKNGGVYRVGAVLLDPENPAIILSRTEKPLFQPETDYEKYGEVPNVVFPCGNVVINGTVYIYYGGADKVIGVATMKVDKLLRILKGEIY